MPSRGVGLGTLEGGGKEYCISHKSGPAMERVSQIMLRKKRLTATIVPLSCTRADTILASISAKYVENFTVL
jgi:hypothetical protein